MSAKHSQKQVVPAGEDASSDDSSSASGEELTDDSPLSDSYVLCLHRSNLFWSSEVPHPTSDVHYVLLKRNLGNESTFAFQPSPVDGFFHIVHVQSRLYVTGEMRHNGLLWLTRKVRKALFVHVEDVSDKVDMSVDKTDEEVLKISSQSNGETPEDPFTVDDTSEPSTYVSISVVDMPHKVRTGELPSKAELQKLKRCYVTVYQPKQRVRNDLGKADATQKSLVLVEDARSATPFEFLAWAPQLLQVALSSTVAESPHAKRRRSADSSQNNEDESSSRNTAGGDGGSKIGAGGDGEPDARRSVSDQPSSVGGNLAVGDNDEQSESVDAAAAGRKGTWKSYPIEDAAFVAKCIEKKDRFGVFVRCNYGRFNWQHKCITKDSRTHPAVFKCCPPGAKVGHEVLGLEEDSCLRSVVLRQVAESDIAANCYLTAMRVGLPFTLSDHSIRLLLSSRPIAVGEVFAASPSSVERFTYAPVGASDSTSTGQREPLGDERWYRDTYDSTLPESVPLPECWPNAERYYYGYHDALSLPAQDSKLVYPYSLLSVRPCEKLKGQHEVVAARYIPKGTAFLYCGPVLKLGTEEEEKYSSTAMSIGKERQIRGGNVMRYVNHHFGFAERGNLVLRRATVVLDVRGISAGQRTASPSRGANAGNGNTSAKQGKSKKSGEMMDIVFFIATEGIPAGRRVLADSYSRQFDSHIERIALCRGLYLTLAEARQLKLPCEGHFLSDLSEGSVIGVRSPKHGTLDFAQVRALEDEGLVSAAPLRGVFPVYSLVLGTHSAPPRSISIHRNDVVYMVPGWDYLDESEGRIRFLFEPRNMILPKPRTQE